MIKLAFVKRKQLPQTKSENMEKFDVCYISPVARGGLVASAHACISMGLLKKWARCLKKVGETTST